MGGVMRFASCTERMEISGIRKGFEGAGPNAINLALGQSDFDTPTHIKEAAIEAIEQGFVGYTHNTGIYELRNALVDKFKRENGISCDAHEIMVTSGASEALFLAISGFVDKGDEVLMGDPSFLSYAELTKLVGGKPVGVPLNEDLNLSPDAVMERITDRTRAIIVNSPSNPTGAVQTEEEIHALADIADDRDLALISDEVYEYFIYNGRHISPGRYSDNVITINATSKAYAMAGWRVGYMIAKGCALENLLKAHQYAQACACSISQKAALEAITGPQDFIASMRDEFRKRRDLMVSSLREMRIDLVTPQGAFYLFPKVGDGNTVAAELAKAGVIVVPGSAFGSRGRENIRISYAASWANLVEALQRMRNIL
jgi:aspartate aminotransferase